MGQGQSSDTAPAAGAAAAGGAPVPRTCPVGMGSTAAASTGDSNSSSSSCPVTVNSDTASAGGCPVMHEDADMSERSPMLNLANNMLIEERQKPGPGQKLPLPTQRMTSSIPKSENIDKLPPHQSGETERWEYPSQQMFYNAMQRKGWKPKEEQMSTIVAIHNSVNERCWQQVLAWEQPYIEKTGKTPKLKKFCGRPKDITPKARLLHLLKDKPLPFDRHDWIVDRDGQEVRYVIDFYQGDANDSPLPVNVVIDARPALDSVGSILDRMAHSFGNLKATFAGGAKNSGSASSAPRPTTAAASTTSAPPSS